MTSTHHGEAEAERPVLQGFLFAAVLAAAALGIESLGALFSRSLTLTADAVHNVPDLAAFLISYAALSGTRFGSSETHTFGTHRLEVFAGLINGAIVFAAGALFGVTAAIALVRGSPFAGPVDPVWLLAAAVPTLGLRLATLRVLVRPRDRPRDLNLRSVFLHVASDIAITGALLATGAILLARPSLGWVDPLAALVVAAILVEESLPLFREGFEVLTERTPRGLSIEAIAESARRVPGVAEVHDIHVWSVCGSLICMTAHLTLPEMSLRESMRVVEAVRMRVSGQFGIGHAVFEVECAAVPP
jgi:cobalt-zinc-cadmium efflux system protein